MELHGIKIITSEFCPEDTVALLPMDMSLRENETAAEFRERVLRAIWQGRAVLIVGLK